MASSATPADEAARQLGRLLTATEAKGIADRLSDGDTLSAALRAVDPARRAEVRELLTAVAGNAASVLHAIEGAREPVTSLSVLWTMPGHLAQSGGLTSSVATLVERARHSITCSTYNFQRSSALWMALHDAAARPEIAVRVYLDRNAADAWPGSSPSTEEVAAHLHPAAVLRTKEFDGVYVRNHAKFLAIDHRFLLVTSANFSWSAEYGNVEFGVLIDNPNLTEAVEREMRDAEGLLYERVIN